MCGIAGFWNADGCPVEDSLLHRMAEVMTARGPDGDGFYTDGALGLAHRRLAVIDLAGGAQPMSTPDGAFTIVFNGEIFNFQELRAELEGEGVSFRTRSDTEVVLRLMERHGSSAVNRLNGFFAFAFYDRAARKLLLARDRMGVKPLYFFRKGPDFAFASELAALTALPFVDRSDLAPDAIVDYLSFQYVPGDRTVFRNVFRLRPAHTLELDLSFNTIRVNNYWRPDFNTKTSLSYADACVRLRELLRDAVARRLIADVPLGVFLSGGLDSAVIAGLTASASHAAPLHCFSIGFGDPAYDESAYAEQTASHLRRVTGQTLEHEIRTVDPGDFSLLTQLVPHFGEPYADASLLPTFLLSRFARSGVTVALSGDGADELFGGYDRYRAMRMLRMFAAMPRFFWRFAVDCLPAAAGERSFAGRIRRLFCTASLPASSQYRAIMTHGADVLTAFAARNPLRLEGGIDRFPILPAARDCVERYMEHDLDMYLPGDVLRKVDVCSMAASLEVRSPFLDHRVVEFAASLPRSWKLNASRRKRILADSCRDFLPSGLATRRKRGFGVPIGAWFRSRWQAPLREHLLEGRVLEPFFDRAAVARLIDAHVAGGADHSYFLFSLLMLALFLEWNGTASSD